MKRFKNILYVLGSDNQQEEFLSEKVQRLALLNNAKVCVVRIMEETFIDLFSKTISSRLEKIISLARQNLENELDHFLLDKKWSDIDISGKILIGKDFITIIQHVLKNNHDLVIKGRLQHDGLDQLAMRLFRKCPCPVWIIRPPPSPECKGILAALDLENQHDENRRLNQKIIELAHSLAAMEQKEAHYLHSWRLDFEAMMRGPRFSLSDEEIKHIKSELQEASAMSLEALFTSAQVQPNPKNIHLLEGENSRVIKNALQQFNIDTLVMGTVGRSGVPGLLIGNKAEKVLSQINCTVLAVKPDGFITPVKI